MLLPFHKYVGPGNKLESGKPFDSDDVIARLHDYAYEYGIVHESDRHFAVDFFWNSVYNYNIHSVIGSLGLYFKYYVEDLYGQIYPASVMAPGTSTTYRTTHAGHQRYANLQKYWAERYHNFKRRNPGVSWQEYKKLVRGQTPIPEAMEAVAGSRRPSTRSSRGSTTTTSNAPPYHQDFMGESSRGSKRSFHPDDYVDESFDVSQLGSSSVAPMELDIENVNRGGGGAQATSTNFDSGSNRKLTIPRSVQQLVFHMNFTKSRIFYCYGFNFTDIPKKNTSDLGKSYVQFCTPLANLPVEMLGFYVDNYEYNLISHRGTSVIKHCSCTVVPQGLRTAFDTGSTLSGTATSEHCAIGISAIGINRAYDNIVHGQYDTNADAPMVPTSVKNTNEEKLLDIFYGQKKMDNANIPMIVGLPRHINNYAVFAFNMETTPTTTGGYAIHDEGYPVLDRHLERFNFVPTVGNVIADWNYSPKNGIIQCKAYDSNYTQLQSDTVSGFFNNNLVTNTTIAAKEDGVVNLATNVKAQSFSNKLVHLQKMYIENTRSKFLFGGPTALKTVPQLHIGILPVPQLNPSKDEKSFQNTAAYFSVVCNISVEINLNSIYALSNTPHAGVDEIVINYGANTGANYQMRQPMGMFAYN
uniref:Capsid protein n=1 Tax=Emberiza pusilla parvoviridae sp. TaxID=2794477 RepID=A0A8A4XCK0_9VIRU|nr:MAG: capsid protein [Emberiza pusilla parvoviridae sp.]